MDYVDDNEMVKLNFVETSLVVDCYYKFIPNEDGSEMSDYFEYTPKYEGNLVFNSIFEYTSILWHYVTCDL